MKILTFNWHEPFLCMLAKCGGSFDVALPESGRGTKRKWNFSARTCPQNMAIIADDRWREKLKKGYYDLVLCHNFKDVKEVAPFPVPIILLFHNKLSLELALGENSIEREKYLADVRPLINRVDTRVYVSKSKRDDWGFNDGFIIPPGIDPEDFLSYKGNIEKILRVGNQIKERDIMLVYRYQEKICASFSTTLLGINPSLGSSRPAKNWEELKSHFATHRLYLNTTLHPFEDGYNLALLEAMATGCPVVSWAHPGSPITSGVSGFLSNDIEELKATIFRLLNDIDLARKIGAHGRETVLEMFDLKRFKASWGSAFNSAVKSHKKRPITNNIRSNPHGIVYDAV